MFFILVRFNAPTTLGRVCKCDFAVLKIETSRVYINNIWIWLSSTIIKMTISNCNAIWIWLCNKDWVSIFAWACLIECWSSYANCIAPPLFVSETFLKMQLLIMIPTSLLSLLWSIDIAPPPIDSCLCNICSKRVLSKLIFSFLFE